MEKLNLNILYKVVRKWMEAVDSNNKNAELSEICDFGDYYGFCFISENKYENIYWCVDKLTYEPFTVRPSQIIKLFKNRKILPLSVIGE